jgi:hypothetical protein
MLYVHMYYICFAFFFYVMPFSSVYKFRVSKNYKAVLLPNKIAC